MQNSEKIKPAVVGLVIGAAAVAIIGFSWGGWVTGGTAQKMAADQARMEVVAALVPICVEQSKEDPLARETLARLKDARPYDRRDMLIDVGWATMPGSKDASRDVANACMDALATKF